MQPCCMKRVCNGCVLSCRKSGIRDCPFCRTAIPKESQVLAMAQKRATAGDPMAKCFLANHYKSGGYGLVKDPRKAVELCEEAAALGGLWAKEAHNILGLIYSEGSGVAGGNGDGGDRSVARSFARSVEHYEEAAMLGHVFSRFNCGVWALNEERRDIALQHFLISAELGHAPALDVIRRLFIAGVATKDDYAGALRGCQAAMEEMSSPARDEAENEGN